MSLTERERESVERDLHTALGINDATRIHLLLWRIAATLHIRLAEEPDTPHEATTGVLMRSFVGEDGTDYRLTTNGCDVELSGVVSQGNGGTFGQLMQMSAADLQQLVFLAGGLLDDVQAERKQA